MVELSLYTDWQTCDACGEPLSRPPSCHDAPKTPPSSPTKPRKLLACADCSCAAYHDTTCQRKHWRAGHRKECKELARAMLPLRELVRWFKTQRRIRRDSDVERDRSKRAEEGDDDDRGRMVWCWWEPDNENGITAETLALTDETWRSSAALWDRGDYLPAMSGFQRSLEPYRQAWPYIGKSSGTNERRCGDKLDDFLRRSVLLAEKLLFCAYCELDAGEVNSARERLVQCISVVMTVFVPSPSVEGREKIKNVMDDAWMELMLSMEEVPEHRVVSRHVANMAVATRCCDWVDPMQRPGYMCPILRGINGPVIPRGDHPSWCGLLESSADGILEDYLTLSTGLGRGGSFGDGFTDVGSGERGSGHDDHKVVVGKGWKEYVLFGTGAKPGDSDAPYTKALLRRSCPGAVSLANAGGGEVIFSRLESGTRIRPHCGPTNLRWTAHLGLVVPDCTEKECGIRIKDEWHGWKVGKVLLFDDSFEHEVRNDAGSDRVVLLIRMWHPRLTTEQRETYLGEALDRRRRDVSKRYSCPR